MESSSAMVPFPLLTTPIETTYRPSTIPYRFASDSPHKPTPAELAWIEVFRKSIPSFRKRAELDQSVPDAEVRSAKFAERYGQILDELEADPESHGGPLDCILLCRLREQCLRELGFRDIFKKVKDEENTKALTLFEKVVQVHDDIEDGGKRLENLIRGIFAGNIFDLGAAQNFSLSMPLKKNLVVTSEPRPKARYLKISLAEVFAKDGISFLASCENLLTRPWVVDDLEAFKLSWMRKSWRKAVIFVDNSGADIVLGILPFARELLRRGTQVILAANDLPSINDITYPELVEIISKVKEVKDGKEYILGVDANNLLLVNSGSDLPVIDLASVSPELAYVANDADLVILEGMGRAIETNLYAQFKCDSVKLGMVKHPEVAEFLGGRLYDCVIKYTEVVL